MIYGHWSRELKQCIRSTAYVPVACNVKCIAMYVASLSCYRLGQFVGLLLFVRYVQYHHLEVLGPMTSL